MSDDDIHQDELCPKCGVKGCHYKCMDAIPCPACKDKQAEIDRLKAQLAEAVEIFQRVEAFIDNPQNEYEEEAIKVVLAAFLAQQEEK